MQQPFFGIHLLAWAFALVAAFFFMRAGLAFGGDERSINWRKPTSLAFASAAVAIGCFFVADIPNLGLG